MNWKWIYIGLLVVVAMSCRGETEKYSTSAASLATSRVRTTSANAEPTSYELVGSDAGGGNVLCDSVEVFATSGANGVPIKFVVYLDTAKVYYDNGEGEDWGYVLTRNGKAVEFVNKDVDENGDSWEMNETVFSSLTPMYYFPSPDGKYLYVTLKPSTAGSCDIFYKIHVYQIECSTGEVKWITNCGGIKLTDNGFQVASQVACLNPEASCAEQRFTARNVYYSYSGKIVKRGKMQRDTDIRKQYPAYYGDDFSPEGMLCKKLMPGETIATI